MTQIWNDTFFTNAEIMNNYLKIFLLVFSVMGCSNAEKTTVEERPVETIMPAEIPELTVDLLPHGEIEVHLAHSFNHDSVHQKVSS